ncbi:hypothetical protein BJ508DRAFT_329126, partial [Ascobolus immersus RN42]
LDHQKELARKNELAREKERADHREIVRQKELARQKAQEEVTRHSAVDQKQSAPNATSQLHAPPVKVQDEVAIQRKLYEEAFRQAISEETEKLEGSNEAGNPKGKGRRFVDSATAVAVRDWEKEQLNQKRQAQDPTFRPRLPFECDIRELKRDPDESDAITEPTTPPSERVDSAGTKLVSAAQMEQMERHHEQLRSANKRVRQQEALESRQAKRKKDAAFAGTSPFSAIELSSDGPEGQGEGYSSSKIPNNDLGFSNKSLNAKERGPQEKGYSPTMTELAQQIRERSKGGSESRKLPKSPFEPPSKQTSPLEPSSKQSPLREPSSKQSLPSDTPAKQSPQTSPAKQEPPKPQGQQPPAKEQRMEAPAKEQRMEAPAKEQRVEAPAKEQRVEAPAKEQRVEAPAKEQRVEQRQANEPAESELILSQRMAAFQKEIDDSTYRQALCQKTINEANRRAEVARESRIQIQMRIAEYEARRMYSPPPLFGTPHPFAGGVAPHGFSPPTGVRPSELVTPFQPLRGAAGYQSGMQWMVPPLASVPSEQLNQTDTSLPGRVPARRAGFVQTYTTTTNAPFHPVPQDEPPEIAVPVAPAPLPTSRAPATKQANEFAGANMCPCGRSVQHLMARAPIIRAGFGQHVQGAPRCVCGRLVTGAGSLGSFGQKRSGDPGAGMPKSAKRVAFPSNDEHQAPMRRATIRLPNPNSKGPRRGGKTAPGRQLSFHSMSLRASQASKCGREPVQTPGIAPARAPSRKESRAHRDQIAEEERQELEELARRSGMGQTGGKTVAGIKVLRKLM